MLATAPHPAFPVTVQRWSVALVTPTPALPLTTQS
jgi:hypothetical protein